MRKLLAWRLSYRKRWQKNVIQAQRLLQILATNGVLLGLSLVTKKPPGQKISGHHLMDPVLFRILTATRSPKLESWPHPTDLQRRIKLTLASFEARMEM